MSDQGVWSGHASSSSDGSRALREIEALRQRIDTLEMVVVRMIEAQRIVGNNRNPNPCP